MVGKLEELIIYPDQVCFLRPRLIISARAKTITDPPTALFQGKGFWCWPRCEPYMSRDLVFRGLESDASNLRKIISWVWIPKIAAKKRLCPRVGQIRHRHQTNINATVRSMPVNNLPRSDPLFIYPANRTPQPNFELMLGQCLRRWTNIKLTLVQRVVFSSSDMLSSQEHPSKKKRHLPNAVLMLGRRRRRLNIKTASGKRVVFAWIIPGYHPANKRCWPNVSLLLGQRPRRWANSKSKG